MDPVLTRYATVALATFLLAFAAACVTRGSPRARAGGVALGLASMTPAWLLPDGDPVVRGLVALFAFSWVMRVIDLRRGSWTLAERLGHVVSIVDTRRLVRTPPRFEGRALAVGIAWAVLARLAWLGLVAAAARPRDGLPIARWGAALVLVYATVSAGYALGRALYAALGFQTGVLHAAPVLSRTVEELWSERWARPVSLWLRDTFFRPWARRRRPVVGGVLAFAVSGAFHGYVVWVALGLWRGVPMAVAMTAFFFVQALLVGVERALRVKRWPPWRSRPWAIVAMLASAPLFLEPAVQVLGFPGP